MRYDYDLIAIGGGSGGLAVAEQTAKLGRRVALIDDQPLGGTCVNAGCVPKKIMWYGAEAATAVRAAGHFGLAQQSGAVDFSRLVAGRRSVVEAINTYWAGYVSKLEIEHVHGRATFADAHTLVVDGRKLTAEKIVVATGGHPFVPPVPGAELGISSDGFFQLETLPKHVAIIGTGYIGVELAGVLRALGSEVDLLGMDDRVLKTFDPFVSALVADNLRADGVKLHSNVKVAALSGKPGAISIATDRNEIYGGYDCVLWAVGRRPNTDQLNLEAAGIELAKGGFIPVNEWQQTCVANIYAVGDVIGQASLTPVAVAAGRRLVRHWEGDETAEPLDYDNVPSVVFAHPPVGTMGLTEAQARSRFDDVSVYESRFTPLKYALGGASHETAFRLICEGKDERVVGLHMVGDGVDEMLQGFAVAINMGARKADFDRTVAIHPTSSEELVTMKAENLVR